MNKYQKGFAPIIIALIVLILAGAGGTGYYLINKQPKLSNNNIDISNWKIYTNNDAGFEIKYPSNWESPFGNWGPGFTAGTSLDNNNLCVIDAMGWSESNDAEIADLIGKGYVKTLIKIDGIDGIRLTRNPAGAGLTEAIYFEFNGKGFRIGRNRGFGDKIEQDCIKNFNQILSSFKFINEELNKDETADWTTYKNDKYGFEVKYPSNYTLFQGTDPIKAKVIPADLNSQKIFITDKPEMFFCCDPDYVSIEILDTYITDLEKYLSDQKIINSDNNYRVKTKGYITFNGEQAYQVQSEYGMDSPGNIILVNHNSKTYFIRDISFSPLNKIISTFKFIEEIKTGDIKIDQQALQSLQSSVDQGHQPWRLDPENVIQADILQYGFIQSDISSIKTLSHSASATANEYEISHNNKTYIVNVIQAVPGEGSIWTISSIKLK